MNKFIPRRVNSTLETITRQHAVDFGTAFKYGKINNIVRPQKLSTSANPDNYGVSVTSILETPVLSSDVSEGFRLFLQKDNNTQRQVIQTDGKLIEGDLLTILISTNSGTITRLTDNILKSVSVIGGSITTNHNTQYVGILTQDNRPVLDTYILFTGTLSITENKDYTQNQAINDILALNPFIKQVVSIKNEN